MAELVGDSEAGKNSKRGGGRYEPGQPAASRLHGAQTMADSCLEKGRHGHVSHRALYAVIHLGLKLLGMNAVPDTSREIGRHSDVLDRAPQPVVSLGCLVHGFGPCSAERPIP